MNLIKDSDAQHIPKPVEDHESLNEINLGLTLYKCMKKYSNKIFQYIADTDETDTYEEVLTKCIRTALKLKEKGISENDIISSCTHNHKNSVVPFIATLFLGATSANFDPNLSHLDTIHLLKLVHPKIIFVSLEALPFMEKCLQEAKVDSELVIFGYSKNYSQFNDYLEPNPAENSFKPVSINNSKETAIILFSSGTTGLPKGICLSHYTFLGDSLPAFLIQNEFVSLLYTTFYWISAVLYLLTTVSQGGARVVCSKFDPVKAWTVIEKYKVTTFFLPPYYATEMLEHREDDVDTRSLQLILTGSCLVTKKLMYDLREAFPHTKILNMYAQTESGIIAIFNPSKPKEHEMQIRKPQSCGYINSKFLWKIVDPETDKIVGRNERGELRLKSDMVMNGYYKMDSSSALDSEGFIKTGDIVYYDDEDCFYVVDRVKEMFKYKGWHILPTILEEVLLTHPAVKEAVVVGIPHEIDGDHPMGIVVLYDGYEDITPKDIELYVEKRVTDNQRLRAGVKFVKEILRTATKKVLRNAMQKMVLNGQI